MHYTPPTPADLRRLKDSLDATGDQMADLFGLAGNNQWRKYTGGEAPREMSVQMLFFGAARLELDDAEIERVLARMRKVGAEVGDVPTKANEPWLLLWSPSQRSFHHDPAGVVFQSNIRACSGRSGRPDDYVPVWMGTEAEVYEMKEQLREAFERAAEAQR